MHFSLQQRLARAEGDLLSAVLLGENQLISYQSSWKDLLDDVSTASASGQIDNDVITMANAVASSVAAIADCFVNLEQKQQNLKEQLLGGMEHILQRLDPVDSSPSTLCSEELPLSIAYSSQPGFISLAYKWLLENIHNPYPPVDVKSAIAQQTGCSVSSVSSWFISSRRRIGWTTLCRDFFKNSRTDTVEAAYRAFVKEDPHRKLGSELVQSFMTIKVAAENLYSSIYCESALAGSLDSVVRDMAEVESCKVDEKRCGVDQGILSKARSRRRRQWSSQKESLSSLCPSRNRAESPASLSESLNDSGGENTDICPSVLVGKKRRASSLGFSPCEGEPQSSVSPKRARCVFIAARGLHLQFYRTSEVDTSAPSLYSSRSAPSIRSVVTVSDDHVPSSQASLGGPNIISSGRRRLSINDLGYMPKHPTISATGPRLHAVSDPLPKPSRYNHFDDWFSTNFANLFEVPPPVDSNEPDLSMPWEVELFSGYLPPARHKADLEGSYFHRTSMFHLFGSRR